MTINVHPALAVERQVCNNGRHLECNLERRWNSKTAVDLNAFSDTVNPRGVFCAVSTLSRKAYRHIHESIAAGRLRPGSVVSEALLAKELGMSRTPVGEAVRQLAAEGLLEQVPRFGTIVRPIDRRDLIELFEMREALESYAAAKSAERVDRVDLAKMQTLCKAMRELATEARRQGDCELADTKLQEFLAADMTLHLLIVQASGNRRIQRVVSETRALARIFRMRRQRHDLELVDDACSFHERIVAALESHDADAARTSMLAHLVASKSQAVEALDREPPLAEPAGELPIELPARLVQELSHIETESP
ncbi:MAG: GntR family transcriptional regulator [Planctomycetota bacterium]